MGTQSRHTFPIWPPNLGRILTCHTGHETEFFVGTTSHRDAVIRDTKPGGRPDVCAISQTRLLSCALSSPWTATIRWWRSAGRGRQRPDAFEHGPEQPARQVSLGEQEPVVPGVLHQAPTGFHEALLETGERPRLDAERARLQPGESVAAARAPEIGDMENLVEFLPYTSMRLHWFPYEITRCTKLDESQVSTRALYGNFKFNPPFPRLERPLSSTSGVDLTNLAPERYGAPAVTTCSVCRTPLAQTGLHQVWISLNVGTDVLPLLVNACSPDCVARLPPAANGYVPGPHTGGLLV